MLKGTKIMLANHTEKNIEDITYDDELLTWNFDEGKFSSAKPIWIRKTGIGKFWFENEMADGRKLLITGRSSTGWGHRGLNINRDAFKCFPQSVGDKFATLDGESELIQSKKVVGLCEFYNIITNHHFNIYANGILTSCSLNNIYPIKNMKFVKEERVLRNITDYDGIPLEYFNGMRFAENTGNIDDLNAYVYRLLTVKR